jgi:hypothetical protein
LLYFVQMEVGVYGCHTDDKKVVGVFASTKLRRFNGVPVGSRTASVGA